MSQISAAAVNELRKLTDRPLMECKKALGETNGDVQKAIDVLRSWDAKAGTKREAKETAEGRVTVRIDGDLGVIVEMRCESAPTAKNENFVKLVDDIAAHIAAHKPADVATLLAQPFGKATVQDRINETIGLIREKMIVQRFEILQGGILGSYIHHDNMGAALVQCDGDKANDELLRDVAAHIVALNPPYFLSSEIPTDLLEKERAFIQQQIQDDPKNTGKPANIIEKIADGKLRTWMAEVVLSEQPMVNTTKYPSGTVADNLKKFGLTPKRFVRYRVGSV
jgi:elongation factor Ts